MSKKITRIITIMLCSLILLTSFSTLKAIAYCLGITNVKKAKDNWCWAACCEMVGKYYNQSSNKTQWDVVRHLKGTQNNPYPDDGGDLHDEAQGCTYITGTGKQYYYSSSPFSCSQINNQINNNGQPILARMGYYNSNGYRYHGHALVISGVYDSELYHVDPDTGEGKFIYYNLFCDGGTDMGAIYEGTVWTY